MASKLLLIFFFGVTAAVEYHLEIRTSTREHAGTDGVIYADLEGKKGTVSFGVLDNPGNDLERNDLDVYVASSAQDIGDIKCVVFTADTGDAWMPEKVVAWSSDSPSDKAYFYNTDVFLSIDAGEGESSLKLCKQGKKTYEIITTTATEDWSDTDNWISIAITGSKGTTNTGILDNKDYNDFMQGESDHFIFPGMKDVKKIKCIEVTVRGEDAWLFTTIQVTEVGGKQKSVLFHNADNVRMSTDPAKGVTSLELCK